MGCVGSSSTATNAQAKPNVPPLPPTSISTSSPAASTVPPPVPDTTTSNSSIEVRIASEANNATHIPSLPTLPQYKKQSACFGAGCYWGTEKYFRYKFLEQFAHLGTIENGHVGFMGPIDAPANPTYREVCSGQTGHVEVYQFEFTGGAPQYEALVRYFFQFHDPTTKNRQGNDKGTQYASVIYCYNEEQHRIANEVKEELQALIDCGKLKPYSMKVVETDIRDSTIFYPAHEEHQDYLTINPNGYCNHRIRFREWPKLEF